MTPETIARVHRIASRCRTIEQAWRLWDWIDHQDEPEPLWDAMYAAAPQWFRQGR